MRGRLPNKIVKKGQFKEKHFDGNMNFLYYEVDKVTEKEKTTVMTTINQSSDLMRILIGKQKNLSDEQLRKVTQFKDFLDRIMVLDPGKRMSFYDAFRTPFIMERMKWGGDYWQNTVKERPERESSEREGAGREGAIPRAKLENKISCFECDRVYFEQQRRLRRYVCVCVVYTIQTVF